MNPHIQALNRLWTSFHKLPINTPDGSLNFLLEELSNILEADSAWLVIAKKYKEMPEDDPLKGWRVFTVINPNVDEEQGKLMQSWLKDETYVLDEFTKRNIALAGQNRAYKIRSLLGEFELCSSRAWELMRSVKSCDRLFGVCSLNKTIELHIGFDRHDDDGEFLEAEVEVVRDLVDNIDSFAWRLAFSYGALENHEQLTKRERDTFIHLLGGENEREIAKEMKVTAKSVHQYVMRVYKKLGVTSRPQLMAKWMSLT